MANGWIRLHRQLRDCYLWQEKPFDRKSAWVDLLLRANHKDGEIFGGIPKRLIKIRRGQLHTSIEKLMEAWGWSKNKVTAYLKELEDHEMIAKNGSTAGTLITIINYDIYQSEKDNQRDNQRYYQKDNQEDSQEDNQRDYQWGDPRGTNKNDKNVFNNDYKNVKETKKTASGGNSLGGRWDPSRYE